MSFLGKPLCALAVLCSAGTAIAQITPPQAAHQYTSANQSQLLQQFREFLSIPNIATDPSGLLLNSDYLVTALRNRGIDARLLSVPEAPPVVYGEIKTPGAQRTIVFYAHYDGQPVTATEWETLSL